jgi:hypothetical protein
MTEALTIMQSDLAIQVIAAIAVPFAMGCIIRLGMALGSLLALSNRGRIER